MKILVIHGPNPNLLGKRDKDLYGTKTLEEINALIEKRARELGAEAVCVQSNGEGDLVDLIQSNTGGMNGIVINPGAFTHYSYALHDALLDTGLPVVEVHLSNIYARERWRRKSVISPIALGVISGFGWRGYIAGLDLLVSRLNEKS